MSMSLPSSTAPIGAAPQGAAPSGVMTELGQVGAAPEAGGGAEAPAASPLAGLVSLPVIAVGSGLGGAVTYGIGRSKATKAVKQAAEATILAQGKGPAAEAAAQLAKLEAPSAGKWLRRFGIAGAIGGAGLLALNFFKGRATTQGGGADQAALEQQAALQQAAMQQQAQQGGGGYTDPTTGEYIPTPQELAAKQAEVTDMAGQLQASAGGGQTPAGAPAPAPTAAGQTPAATTPVGTATPAANGSTQTPATAGTPAPAPGQAPAGTGQIANAVQQPGTASLVGSTITLASGIGADGTEIATSGPFAIDAELGTFPTAAAASAAIHTAMADLGIGMNSQRFAVIQTGNTFRAVHAEAGTGTQALSAQQGTVVQWDAMTWNQNTGLNAYSWNQQRGAISQNVQLGGKPFEHLDQQVAAQGGGQVVQQPQTPGGPLQPPAPGAQVTGGGAVAPVATSGATAFDPNAVVGQTFTSLPSPTSAGAVAPGGTLQIQGFVPGLQGGFATAQEAQLLAQQVAPGIAAMGPYARVATLQGADGRFYNYVGSIVARPTVEIRGAAPVAVFAA